MNLPAEPSVSSAIGRPFPRFRLGRAILWVNPEKPGFYGDLTGGEVILTTNNHAALARLGEQGGCAYALKAGGYSIPDAAALGLLSRPRVMRELENAAQQLSTPGSSKYALVVPGEVMRQMGWQDNESVSSWRITPASDPAARSAVLIFLSRLLTRGLVGLKLGLWLVLIGALPLFVFGLPALVTGGLVLFSGGFLSALLWPWLPGKAVFRSAILALLGALGTGLLVNLFREINFPTAVLSALAGAVGFFLASILVQGLDNQ
ncbi:MAG: hypothetical protein MUC85_08465 [Anaerolineales bacterium]|jgi:hypothetical protein|nr:hypothetical protein [Anaerolineales bacterium]